MNEIIVVVTLNYVLHSRTDDDYTVYITICFEKLQRKVLEDQKKITKRVFVSGALANLLIVI